MSETEQPATKAITAGRAYSRTSLAPALWASTTWESEGLADANRRATANRAGEFYSRYSNPTVRSFEEAIAALEGADEALAFASGMGAIATVVFAPVLERRPHRRPAPALRRHARVPAGPVPAHGHRDHAGRRHRARRVRRRRASRSHHAGARRDPVEPTPRAGRPRRAGCAARADHRGRLHVRHATRPAATGPRRAPLAALGHQGHRRPQRRNARRDRRRAAN